jgi:hypothetical protein
MCGTFVTLTVLSVFFLSDSVLGRMRWAERDGRPIFLHPRRFSQEYPAVIDKIADACPGEVCGKLAGEAITPLLALQPECSQQDFADYIIRELQCPAEYLRSTDLPIRCEQAIRCWNAGEYDCPCEGISPN